MILKLLILTLALVLAPTYARADDASTLGPQSSSSASSTETLNILQPANPGAVQSADSTSGGAAQSSGTNAAALQLSGNSDSVKLLIQGDADGQARDGEAGLNLGWLWYLLVTLGVVTALTAIIVIAENRRTRQSS